MKTPCPPRTVCPRLREGSLRASVPEGLDQSCAAAPSRFIAIDGKTLRQSFDAFADRKAAHVLSAFAVDHQIILAHEVVDEKSNEIPAVQTLIATLGLRGRVFTLDAMHCGPSATTPTAAPSARAAKVTGCRFSP